MMGKNILKAALVASSLAMGIGGFMMPIALAQADARVGSAAPTFTAVDSNGKSRDLSDFRGKTVVLEWTNHECPFVKKHYGSGNMQALQKKWTEKGVVWLSVISSPPGEQGNVSPEQANKLTVDRSASPSAVLIDLKRQVARLYGAQTTPHMYVINAQGELAYMGGIDDKPSTRADDIQTAKNFVDEALSAVVAGKPVSAPATRAYGCSIKYTS